MNVGKEPKEINIENSYREMTKTFTGVKNILTNSVSDLGIKIEGESLFIGILTK